MTPLAVACRPDFSPGATTTPSHRHTLVDSTDPSSIQSAPGGRLGVLHQGLIGSPRQPRADGPASPGQVELRRRYPLRRRNRCRRASTPRRTPALDIPRLTGIEPLTRPPLWESTAATTHRDAPEATQYSSSHRVHTEGSWSLAASSEPRQHELYRREERVSARSVGWRPVRSTRSTASPVRAPRSWTVLALGVLRRP